MDKDIIDLQKGCAATAVIVIGNDFSELSDRSKYIVIKNVDKFSRQKQLDVMAFVKDRERNGSKLENDRIIVLTVESQDCLRNIIKELYQFCIVA